MNMNTMNDEGFQICQLGQMYDVYEFLPNGRFNAKCCRSFAECLKWIKARKQAR